MELNTMSLDRASVDVRLLSTNFGEVIPDCSGVGQDVKTEIINSFPLYNWLINTGLSATVRRNFSNPCITKKTDGTWTMEIPRTIWTELPKSTSEECCWVPFDFAKCAGNVPLKLLCLKDCTSMLDALVDRKVKAGTAGAVSGIAGAGDSMEEVNLRVAKMSMAFFTAYTTILGLDNTYTDILKPFHGLLQVMQNPAVVSINGGNVLSAFDSLYCRMSVLGGLDNMVVALNPITYQSILAVVTYGQYGELPTGWTRNGDVLKFHNISFIQDRFVPVDLANGTGEAWVLSGDSVGLFLATDLIPSSDFIFKSTKQGETPANGCAEQCTYMYNYGAAFNNNANKLAMITSIPITGACASAAGDLGEIIAPTTLIPSRA